MRKGPLLVKLYFQKKGSILNDNQKIYNAMNNYFTNITKVLNLKPYKWSDTMNIHEMISTLYNHKSIKRSNNTSQMRLTTALSLQRFLKMKLKKKIYI